MEVHDGEEITIKDLLDTPKVEEPKHKDNFDLEWKRMNKKAITYTRPNSNFIIWFQFSKFIYPIHALYSLSIQAWHLLYST